MTCQKMTLEAEKETRTLHPSRTVPAQHTVSPPLMGSRVLANSIAKHLSSLVQAVDVCCSAFGQKATYSREFPALAVLTDAFDGFFGCC